MARTFRVSGVVKLQIEIGTDGHVTGTKVMSGPPMLVGAAEDCVKQWVFKPVLREGQPVRVSTVVWFLFDFANRHDVDDQKIVDAFFPLDKECKNAVSANSDPAQEADVCRKAATVAERFGPERAYTERRSAFVYASTALRRNKEKEGALAYADKAVEVVKQGHDDDAGSNEAYTVRAQAEAGLGQLAKASDDLTQAEDFQRSVIEKLPPNEPLVKREVVPRLKGLLAFHAQILTAMGKAGEAQAKTDEAAKL